MNNWNAEYWGPYIPQETLDKLSEALRNAIDQDILEEIENERKLPDHLFDMEK